MYFKYIATGWLMWPESESSTRDAMYIDQLINNVVYPWHILDTFHTFLLFVYTFRKV